MAAAPGSRLSGLLRFLRLLGEHPWQREPLVVDPGAEMTGEQRAAALRAHRRLRAEGKAPALAMCSPRDGGAPLPWTRHHPTPQALSRAAALARRSAAALESLLLDGSSAAGGDAASEAAAAAFCRESAEFDVLIHLRPEGLPGGSDRELRLGPKAAGRRGGGDSVSAALAANRCPSDKHSRAILKGIPESEWDRRSPISHLHSHRDFTCCLATVLGWCNVLWGLTTTSCTFCPRRRAGLAGRGRCAPGAAGGL